MSRRQRQNKAFHVCDDLESQCGSEPALEDDRDLSFQAFLQQHSAEHGLSVVLSQLLISALLFWALHTDNWLSRIDSRGIFVDFL